VGLSLCQAEASIAAPLTSRAATVQAMVAVIAEGRCSLAAAYAIFRFIMSYALIQVQRWVLRECSTLDMHETRRWHEGPLYRSLTPDFTISSSRCSCGF
jgi:hypothetical protein